MVRAGPNRRPGRRWLWVIALSGAFLARLGFGLLSDFWTEDERQVYLIGLAAHARGAWPYFGADIVWTQSRLPGALQGLLVGAPFRVLPIPEAPYLLLNVLSMGALCLLAWYLTRRLPELPPALLWAWLLSLPWTLNFSTHIVNTSYILPAAIVFFVGFFEAHPALSRGWLPARKAWFMMGAATLWMVQIHMSWVLLPPYLAAALWRARGGARRILAHLGWWTAGAALVGSTLLPTIWRYGLAATGGAQQNLAPHLLSPGVLVSILARLLSFASYELNRFVGLSSARRLLLLSDNPWLIPLVAMVGLVGLAQPLALAGLWFRRRGPGPDWRAVKLTLLGTALWVYGSYFFSVKEPLAHAFYVTLPVVVIYAAQCAAFASWSVRWRRWTAAAIVANALLHVGLAVARGPERSLYRRRWLVQQAIGDREDRLLGERRRSPLLPAEPPASPRPVHEAALGEANPRADLKVLETRWTRAGFGLVSCFEARMRNRNRGLAYVDLQYLSRYSATDGAPLGSGRGVVKDILQPGESRAYRFADGLVRPGAEMGALEIVAAEPVLAAATLGGGPTEGEPSGNDRP